MSALCNHTRADYHHDGETCMYARDLRPGDKLSVLRGSAQAIVREADPAEEDGWMSVLLDVSWDGPTLISSHKILSVRRPEPDPEPHRRPGRRPGHHGDRGPRDVVDDEHELHRYVDEREELRLDDLVPTGTSGALCITEHTLDEAYVAEAGDRS